MLFVGGSSYGAQEHRRKANVGQECEKLPSMKSRLYCSDDKFPRPVDRPLLEGGCVLTAVEGTAITRAGKQQLRYIFNLILWVVVH